VDTVAYHDRLRVHATIEVREQVREPVVDFWIDDDNDTRILATSTLKLDHPLAPIEPGDRLHVAFETHNTLQDGRYHIGCSLLSGSASLDIVALVHRHRSFHSYNAVHVYGAMDFEHTFRVDREP
jgi:hypothetical protein